VLGVRTQDYPLRNGILYQFRNLPFLNAWSVSLQARVRVPCVLFRCYGDLLSHWDTVRNSSEFHTGPEMLISGLFHAVFFSLSSVFFCRHRKNKMVGSNSMPSSVVFFQKIHLPNFFRLLHVNVGKMFMQRLPFLSNWNRGTKKHCAGTRQNWNLWTKASPSPKISCPQKKTDFQFIF